MRCQGRGPDSGRHRGPGIYLQTTRPRHNLRYRGDGVAPYAGAVATLEDLEARVAALEAERADYRAVLTAVNALGANQREHAIAIKGLQTDVAEVKVELSELKSELRGFRRSTEEGMAELKDLIIGLRDS